MKTIQPTNAPQLILIDDQFFDHYNQWKWRINAYGYATRTIRINCISRPILMHRLLLNLTIGDLRKGDHIDRNKTNNQLSNLRIANNQQNTSNRIGVNASSQYKGVCWYKRDQCWKAQITYNYKSIHLGYFHTELDAAKAYNEAAIKYFGTYALLNRID